MRMHHTCGHVRTINFDPDMSECMEMFIQYCVLPCGDCMLAADKVDFGYPMLRGWYKWRLKGVLERRRIFKEIGLLELPCGVNDALRLAMSRLALVESGKWWASMAGKDWRAAIAESKAEIESLRAQSIKKMAETYARKGNRRHYERVKINQGDGAKVRGQFKERNPEAYARLCANAEKARAKRRDNFLKRRARVGCVEGKGTSGWRRTARRLAGDSPVRQRDSIEGLGLS